MSMKLYRSIFSRMLAYQRKRRLIARSRGLGADEARQSLSYTEEAVLFTLLSSPAINTRELANLLGVERSWMSRIVGALEKRELLAVKSSAADKRSKELRVTKKAERLLVESEVLSSEIMEESLAPLSSSQRKKFSNYLSTFADGVGAPRYDRPAVHPVYWELWRLSRSVGISSGAFSEAALSTTQMQVLFVLKESSCDVLLASDIERMLPFDASTLSRVLSDFEKRGWVKRSPLKDDRRSLSVEMTNAGEVAHSKALESGVGMVKKGLRDLDASKLLEFSELLLDLVGSVPEALSSETCRTKVEVHKLSVKEFSKTVAKFDSRLSAGELSNAFPSGGYVLKAGEEVHGLVAAHKENESHALYLCGNHMSEKEILGLVKSCLRGEL